MTETKELKKSFDTWLIIWSGQIISSIGTKMNRFAIAAWVYDIHKSAAEMTLVHAIAMFTMIAFGLLAGTLLDRFNRKRLLIAADLMAAFSSIALLILYASHMLQIWYIYLFAFISGICEAFIIPGLITFIGSTVPKKHIGRAHAMLTMVFTLGETAGNALAGYLMAMLGISWVITIDIASFLLSAFAIMIVKVTLSVEMSDANHLKFKNILQDCISGIKYIINNRVLYALLLFFVALNALGAAHFMLQRPMILAKTGENTRILGTILSANGLGGLLGGLIMTIWSCPRKKANGMIIGGLIYMLGTVIFVLSKNLIAWSIVSFLLTFAAMILNVLCYTIWQLKVPNELVGRVFSTRRLIVQVSTPLTGTILGFLADHIFEPVFNRGSFVSPLIGDGPGSGMAFLILLSGIIGIVVAVSGFFITTIRQSEYLIPDVIIN